MRCLAYGFSGGVRRLDREEEEEEEEGEEEEEEEEEEEDGESWNNSAYLRPDK